MQIAALFPGQGSQSQGMLAQLSLQHEDILAYFHQASHVLGEDLWQIVQDNPEDKLNQTYYTQPAMLTADVALYECWFKNQSTVPSFACGHSLGEYAALVVAGALAFNDAVKLVIERARLMQEAVPEGVGAMAAIVGLSDAQVEAICEQASVDEWVAPANYNAIGQVVIAGHRGAVEKACELALQAEARMAKIIPVSVPAHCELLKPIAAEYAQYVENTPFKSPQFPVIHNVDVKSHQNPDDIRQALILQLYKPVRWVETIQKLRQEGITQAVEFGPGKVLQGLNRRIDKALKTGSVSDQL